MVDLTDKEGDDEGSTTTVTERRTESKIRRNFHLCLTRAEILSVGIIPQDDNIFNSRQDVTGSARAKVMLYRTYR